MPDNEKKEYSMDSIRDSMERAIMEENAAENAAANAEESAAEAETAAQEYVTREEFAALVARVDEYGAKKTKKKESEEVENG